MFWAITAIIAGTGAYLGAYLKKKGENLATHEDLDKLVEQVRATTEATKRIEGQISSDIWDRQQQWEMKRDAVVAAVQAMLACKGALMAGAGTIKALQNAGIDPRSHDNGAKAIEAFNQKLNDLEAKHLITQLTCSQEFWKALWSAKLILGNGGSSVFKGELAGYDAFLKTMTIVVSNVLGLARRELGAPTDFTPQSSESSAIPGPGSQAPESGKP